MRKIIAVINMTLDAVADHTAGVPDEELHQHYEQLMLEAGTVLYGSITFNLMKFWQELAQNPSGKESMDRFAQAIDQVPKLVFSRKLTTTGWHSATLANTSLEETVKELKQGEGKDVIVGSKSLIMQLLNLNLVDEFQLCIHPVIAAGGAPLFDNIQERMLLRLSRTKTFNSGAIILYYKPVA